MSRTTKRLGVIAGTWVAALGMVGGLTGMVGASEAASSSPPSLSALQAQAAAAITLRVNDLNAAITKVNAAKNLGSEASTLDAYLQSDIAPLQQLGQQIAADTTVRAVQAAAPTIFTNYRVLALVLPAAHVAGAASTITNGAIPELTADSSKAASRVNASNESTLDPLIADLNQQINAATQATSGLAATVLAYMPAQWNANKGLLNGAHGSMSSTSTDVKNALFDLKRIRAALKSEKGTSQAPASPAS